LAWQVLPGAGSGWHEATGNLLSWKEFNRVAEETAAAYHHACGSNLILLIGDWSAPRGNLINE
jgi:hypothetical protein